jgi:hypothetical protein
VQRIQSGSLKYRLQIDTGGYIRIAGKPSKLYLCSHLGAKIDTD